MGHVHFSRRAVLGASQIFLAGAFSRSLPSLAAGASGAPAFAVAPGTARLSANENPFGPGPAARAAISAAIGDSWKYPMAEEMSLKARIAEREGVTPRHVLIGDGSSEILHLAAMTYGVQGAEVITASPTFSLLADHARTMGAVIREIPLDAELRHDLAAMAAALTPATRLVYVCNPNNPTGTMVPDQELREFITAVSRRSVVLVDEAYIDIAAEAREHSAVARVIAGDEVIVVRTFSKLHGLAGLRIGYALARPDIIERLGRLKLVVASSLGLAAATASYADTAFQEASRRAIAEGLAITRAALDDLGLRYAATRANFVFFDTGAPVGPFLAAMRERGFSLGRPFPPYMTWCRVSMGTVEQMRAFDRVLRAHYATPPG